MEKLGFFVKNKIVYVDLERTNNKNMYLKVTKDNSLLVTAPKRVPKKKVEEFVSANIEKFAEYIFKSQAKVLYSFQDNFVYVFGKKLKLVVLSGFKKESASLKGTTLYLETKLGTEEESQKLLLTYLKRELVEYMTKSQRNYEKQMKAVEHKIRVTDKTSTWGTNNIQTHSISYALRLVHYSKPVIDYVIVHELSHYFQPDHSKGFWDVVKKYYLTYKEIKKQLRHDEAIKEEE